MSKYEYEAERQEHMKRFGQGMLYCVRRNTICAYMERVWETGQPCGRTPCIKDDPEDIAQQKRIARNRREAEKSVAKEDPDDEAAPIRDQRNMIKGYVQKTMDEIHDLEEASQEAFRNNRPKDGHTLFIRARIKRGELRKYMEERGIKDVRYEV